MANGHYIGVAGVARKVVSPYIGVSGVARKVTAGYVGVDGVARLFFAPDNGGPIVLEVEKITSNTYAIDTTYENEEFILLDIYPKTNGTVSVTYGGLTKTITDTSGAAEPNAQQVFFGTFYGVSDNVATPASGELTIRGDCRGFSTGSYIYSSSIKGNTKTYSEITAVIKLEEIEILPPNAFYECARLTTIPIPDTVKSIGTGAFCGCTGLAQLTIPKNVAVIEQGMFYDTGHGGAMMSGQNLLIEDTHPTYACIGGCVIEKATNKLLFGFYDSVIPQSVKTIGNKAFYYVQNMPSNLVIPSGVEVVEEYAFQDAGGITDLTIPASVTNIYQGAFQNISTLARVVVLSTTPPTVPGTVSDSYIFTDKNLDSITVPKGCADAYKSALGWKWFADYIVEAT